MIGTCPYRRAAQAVLRHAHEAEHHLRALRWVQAPIVPNPCYVRALSLSEQSPLALQAIARVLTVHQVLAEAMAQAQAPPDVEAPSSHKSRWARFRQRLQARSWAAQAHRVIASVSSLQAGLLALDDLLERSPSTQGLEVRGVGQRLNAGLDTCMRPWRRTLWQAQRAIA